MKRTIFPLATLLICISASAQIAKTEIKESIPGICNSKEVYNLFPVAGQEKAICPVAEDSIEKILNKKVSFLRKHKDYTDKGTVNIIVNCNGEVVKCAMDNRTKNEQLDKQIIAVFKSFGNWEAGRLDGKPVDSSRSYAIQIKNGALTLD